ncbi:tRNA (34-2'-O)-methyltransferase regulator WDR6 [Rhodnius prolixus]|uniref:tRNA (34-2'-O)-methyltransferase regulator WDR6 n=1 Tax=Rhodnius prolixus TaxID=13249 RepID=UPI003D18F66A
MIKSVFLKTNVTSIKFFGNYLLAGIGDELHVYTENAKSICWKEVCSIKVFPPQNIYGIFPKNDRILLFGGRKLANVKYCWEPLKLVIEKNCSFPDWILDAIWLENEVDAVAILSANNVVYKFNILLETVTCKFKCEELCVIYSGKIINTEWNDIVVLAGTVFQEIVVWNYCPESGKTRILHRLKGHKGVIFSVNYDSRSNLICSTSDDRTVRIWKVESAAIKNRNDWNNNTISLKVSIFSHIARVWKSQIISKNKVISIGEDSLISMWNENGDCLNKWYGHQGGAVWSIDCSEELGLIATGGSDGGINMWPLCERVSPSVVYHSNFSDLKSIPRSIVLAFNGNIILMTNHGKLMYYTQSTWINCEEDDRFASYCLLKMSPNRKIIAMGSICGHLKILKAEKNGISKIWVGRVIEGRIYSLMWLSDSLIITCGSDGELILWELLKNPEPDLKRLGQYTLPLCKERWITSALRIADYILCGDRCGSIHLYELNSTQKGPLHTIKKLHGCKGVTSIQLIGDTIISTGRDGFYRQLSVNEESIKVLDSNKLQLDWIAKIEETHSLGAVLVGFHDVNLIIWSYSEGRPLLKLDCGGGHRSWDCHIDEASESLVVAFIKSKSVNIYRRNLKLIYYKTAEAGFHSKSINAAFLLDTQSDSNNFIVTGGEDNTLRLFCWNGKTFNSKITLNRHISSIRAIHAIKDRSSNSSFVASCGGRGQLIMWQALECKGNVKLVEVASHMVREGNHKRQSKRIEPLSDAETRYMDVNIVQLTETDFLILGGCSDGLLRLLNFNAATNNITLVKVCSFHDHCILKVTQILWNHIVFVITLTTDGIVAFWNLDDLLKQTDTDNSPVTYRIHSLGVNSCSLVQQEDFLILATGSDDSALRITVFELKKNNKHLTLTFWIEKTLHTCQITGVKILDDFIISVALDQRVSLLRWKYNSGILAVNVVMQFATSIPDIHGLQAWLTPQKKINICVHGLGIELFKQICDITS